MRRRRRLLVTLAVAAVLALAATGLYRLVNSRTYQVAGTLVSRFDTPEKVVALTFDDGPDEHAAEVLAALAAEDARATFYVVGSQMERFPKETAALVAAGHELGNHTYTHRRMVFVSPDTVKDEVERTNALIRAAGQRGNITFRPPTGKKLLTLPMYLAEHHQTTVMWDVEPDSGKTPTAQEIVAEVRAEVRPGSIVLLHPWYGSGADTRAAIRGVVSALRAEGYTFVSVSEMLAGSQA
ncbi:polysaccharide deacetylase family protein [Nonomuraea sp. SMC257]|uniref:Polysaccharide deacetylase family protein n=1 Tax=Nonomuraea montanisoli TaxID=2741721 RepID=A0A7Y6IFL0_9ACTN|nr:polysaccharide deacetylase family protein [Nonomuraea montanisoli]NUW37191.1 polysaccharide deacetylase family protein [Nonomuraea montanisoli]